MTTRRAPFSVLVAPLALLGACGGCGDDDAPGRPDAADVDAAEPPDALPALCAELLEPVATFTAYPATYTGDVLGAGADLHVPEGRCDVESDRDNPAWFDQVGEDVAIRLDNLTVGATYAVSLRTDVDLGFYVVTGCDPDTSAPAAGQCLVFDDNSNFGEDNYFTAPAGPVWIVVDSYLATLPRGAFELHVLEPDCVVDADCTGDTTRCVEFECVGCLLDLDCTNPATPACDRDGGTCVAGHDQCTGDDAADDPPTSDDGPAGATVIAVPTTGTPTVVTAAICSAPQFESDWYRVDVPAAGGFGFGLAWASASDLDVYVRNSGFAVVAAGTLGGNTHESFVATLGAGTYYVQVLKYGPLGVAAAEPYTLTMTATECGTSFDCESSDAPVCNAAGACVAGPAQCVGDDAADDGGGDDGPAGARDLTVAGTATGAVCSAPLGGEADYYAITVEQGEGLEIELDWTGTADLDVVVVDDTGAYHGVTFWQKPERITLTYLPAGVYYVIVTLYTGNTPQTAAVAYTISATRTAAQVCATTADCAAEHSTQIYRGACTAGACTFIPPGTRANGAACDSNDDCGSSRCSYVAFEADADESVCTITCTADNQCGFAPGLTCSTGDYRICTPTCASDLDCGANTGSPALDAGEPWDYFVCTQATSTCFYDL
jgi:hypothetical protein